MPNLKSKRVAVSLSLFIVSAIILSAYNPAAILFLHKTLYVKYVRITKSEFTSRFKPRDLEVAIGHAKSQPWVQKQIQNDLAPFKGGVTSKHVDEWFKTFQHPTENKLAKFTVKDGVVTVDVPAEYTKLRAYKTIFSVIELLAKQKYIPDCKFIVALNDYLAFVPQGAKRPAAIFTFAKHTEIPIEKNTILVPDWMNVRFWDVLRGRIRLANKLYPWSRKAELIHWRGGTADSMRHRAQLLNLNKSLNFLDVAFTEGSNTQAFMDPENSVKYKYQVALDGSRCTWERMIWQMSSNTVLIKPNSPQKQWYHMALEPYINYVPLENIDEHNVNAVYTWLQKHDAHARQISRNANKFARENFKTQDFFAYYALVLQEYAKLYKG